MAVFGDYGVAGIGGMLAALIVIVIVFSWLAQRGGGEERAVPGGSTGEMEPVQAVAEALRANRAAKDGYKPDKFETVVVELGTACSICSEGRLDDSLSKLTPNHLERAATLALALEEPECEDFFAGLVPLMEMRQSLDLGGQEFGVSPETESYEAALAVQKDRFAVLDVNKRLWVAANRLLEDRYPWGKAP